MFASTVIIATLFSTAFANVFITQPVEGTVCHGGQKCQINWQDNSDAPSLQQFGNAKVSVYTGNAIQQTEIQVIVPSVNVATTSSLEFTVDPTAGANSDDYFIRVESLATKDPNNAQFPAEAFSAKFTLDQMTGTFNATVLAQISGTVTAPIGGPTGTASNSTSASGSQASGLTTKVASTVTPSSTVSASGSTNSAAATNGAAHLAVAPIASMAAATLVIVGSAFTLLL